MNRENLTTEIKDALETVENEMAIVETEPSHSDLLAKVYNLPDTAIAELSVKYSPLKINGAVDKSGRAIVHTALMHIRDLAGTVDKTRLKTNEKAQAWIKVNNAEAKRITALLEPIRSTLQAERDKHDAEVEAIRMAAQRALDLRNQKRMEELLAVGATIGLAAVVTMDDQAYVDYLALVTKAFEEKQALEAKQKAEAKAKAEAEAVEKARLDKEAAEKLEVERVANAKAKAENDRITAELKAEKDEFAKVKAEAEAKAKAENDRIAAELKAPEQAALVQNRVNHIAFPARSLRPTIPTDAAMMEGYACSLEVEQPPEMDTEAGRMARVKVAAAHRGLIEFIRKQAATLNK